MHAHYYIVTYIITLLHTLLIQALTLYQFTVACNNTYMRTSVFVYAVYEVGGRAGEESNSSLHTILSGRWRRRQLFRRVHKPCTCGLASSATNQTCRNI